MGAAAREEIRGGGEGREGRVGGEGGIPQRAMKKGRQTALSEARRGRRRGRRGA
jgi:hypothetical protein